MVNATAGSNRAMLGWLLVAFAWLSVLANMVISPILPAMQADFADHPNVDLLISLASTSPAFFVALLAIPAGYLGSKIGHKKVLVWSALLYAMTGIAPLFLDDLEQIVATRFAVGISEAAVMTCSTALLGSFFFGKERERYLAFQTGTAPVIAIVAVSLAGLLGNNDWHNAFGLYAFGFLLFVCGVLLLPPDRKPDDHSSNFAEAQSTAEAKDAFEGDVDWFGFSLICLLTVFALTAFLVTIIQLPFLLSERGISETSEIGFIASVATLSNPLGALFFGLVSLSRFSRLSIALGALGLGFGVMAFADGWQLTLAGAIIANFGAGLIMPLLITWALATVPVEKQGVGTGAWMSANFIGQFLSPLAILALRNVTGSLTNAVATYSIVCVIGAVLALVYHFNTRALPAEQ